MQAATAAVSTATSSSSSTVSSTWVTGAAGSGTAAGSISGKGFCFPSASLAKTLIGAFGTYLLRDKNKWLAPLPPIIANIIIVPFVLAYVYHLEGGIPYFMLTVGIGEVISCGILGMLLRTVLQKYRKYIFDVQK